jgi:hypothetical protein
MNTLFSISKQRKVCGQAATPIYIKKESRIQRKKGEQRAKTLKRSIKSIIKKI